MEEKRYSYKSEKITVSYNPKLCIHAAECANGLPAVFDPRNKPWVNPDAADADSIAGVIDKCPSSALKYERHDGGMNETMPKETTVSIQKNGPIYLRGDIEIVDAEGNKIRKDTRLALCRCGASKNKPFCDNSHLEVGFNG